MKECTTAISIFRERGREHALFRAVAEPSKMSHELGGQVLLILYEEVQFIDLNHFYQQSSNDHIHISLDI